MIQMNFSPFMVTEVQQKRAEIYKEMAQIRLADQVTNTRKSENSVFHKMMARFGKLLVSLGATLVQRNTNPNNHEMVKNPQTKPEGCA